MNSYTETSNFFVSEKLGREIIDAKNHFFDGSESPAVEPSAEPINPIIGESISIQRVHNLVGLYSKYDAPVLITGETGTGKELAARGLHYNGDRHSKPFIAVNCATLSDELFSSELFGHIKGSFTDARKDKKGFLSVADKGTLFLDEIDSLSLKSQAALLRFLQEKEYRPVGSEQTYQSNARIVASSNCKLEEKIKNGEFREDLYYRLYILTVHMPPLRQRSQDIILLIDHFLVQFEHQYQQGKKTMSNELVDYLRQRPWRGNVRELENLIHRLYLCCAGEIITNEVLNDIMPFEKERATASVDTKSEEVYISHIDNLVDFSFTEDKRKAMEVFEKKYVEKVLEKANGNITLAAQLCAKERRAFGKLVKKYNIKKEYEC